MKTPDAVPPHAIAQALADELCIAEIFHALLLRERESLISGDIESVAALAREKLELAARLEAQSDRRNRLLALLGDGTASSEQLDTSSRFADAWARLREQLARTAEANRINGVLISSRLQGVSRALGALDGVVAGQPPLYSRDGAADVGAARSASRWAA